MLSYLIENINFPKKDHCWLEYPNNKDYFENKKCNQCSSILSPISQIISVNISGLSIGHCQSCGHIQKMKSISLLSFKKHYATRWLKNRQENKFTPRDTVYKKISKYHDHLKDKNVLEIGCGNGRNLFFFEKSGFKTFGCDPSSSEIETGKKNGITSLFNLSAEEYLKKTRKKFDIIFFHNSIQYIEKPFDILNLCLSKLNDDGIIYSESGNFFDINICFSTHLAVAQNYITEDSISSFAKKNRKGIKLFYQKNKVTFVLGNRFSPPINRNLIERNKLKKKIKKDLFVLNFFSQKKKINLHIKNRFILLRKKIDKDFNTNNFIVSFISNKKPAIILK